MRHVEERHKATAFVKGNCFRPQARQEDASIHVRLLNSACSAYANIAGMHKYLAPGRTGE
jgi:hypothetical protein